MAEHRDDGGPAFPVASETFGHFPGMSMRDYFAAHASDEDIRAQINVLLDLQMKRGESVTLPDGWRPIARYMHADAMLKARAA